jgi:hypothetical protein
MVGGDIASKRLFNNFGLYKSFQKGLKTDRIRDVLSGY